MSRSGLRDARRGVEARNDQLETERDFLLKSLQDLEEEHEKGDVSDDDYERLHDRYTARAAEVLRAIAQRDGAQRDGAQRDTGWEDGRPGLPDDGGAGRSPKATAAAADPLSSRTLTEPSRKAGRTKRKSPLLVGGIICLVTGVTVALVVSDTSARLPGNTASGGVTLAPGQQEQRELSQAGVLQQEGQYSQALALYEEVLSQDPGNSGALSEAGWLEFEAGILGGNEKSLEQGESNEQSAVAADPGLPSARAYLGSMYFIEGELAQAVVQYGEFLADKPTAAEMSPFLPDIKKAFSETTTPLPAIAGENSASRTSGSQKPAKKK